MAKDILDINDSLSRTIRENYAKRNTDPKCLKAAIQACENQIKIAKDVAKEILKGEKQYIFKSDKELINELKKENDKDLAIISGTSFQKSILDQIDKQMAEQPAAPITLPQKQRYFTGIRTAAEFNKNIHKSKDDFIIIPGKLSEHLGYKQLCTIREKEGNFLEVIRLAEQAKSEGWEGDWDKRIEKAKKKLNK